MFHFIEQTLFLCNRLNMLLNIKSYLLVLILYTVIKSFRCKILNTVVCLVNSPLNDFKTNSLD